MYEASGLLAVGVDSIYVPAVFRGAAPLSSRKVRIPAKVAQSLQAKLANLADPCPFCGSILGFEKGRGGWMECLNCGGV